MSLRFAMTSIADDFETALREKHLPVAKATTAAMGDAADLFKTGARAAIRAGGFSQRFANALRVDVYPDRGKPSIDAAVYAWHKVPHAGVFEDGAAIKGKPRLWLPLPSAPKGAGGKRIPAADYFKQIGQPLYPINLPGKKPMLGALVRMTGKRKQKKVSVTLLRRGRNPGGKGIVHRVPLYIGVDAVTIRKKFSIRNVAANVSAQIPALYEKHFRDE